MTMIVGPSTAAMNYTGLGGIGSVYVSINYLVNFSSSPDFQQDYLNRLCHYT